MFGLQAGKSQAWYLSSWKPWPVSRLANVEEDEYCRRLCSKPAEEIKKKKKDREKREE